MVLYLGSFSFNLVYSQFIWLCFTLCNFIIINFRISSQNPVKEHSRTLNIYAQNGRKQAFYCLVCEHSLSFHLYLGWPWTSVFAFPVLNYRHGQPYPVIIVSVCVCICTPIRLPHATFLLPLVTFLAGTYIV